MTRHRLVRSVERDDEAACCADPLSVLDSLILWEQFRPVLEKALDKERRRHPVHYRFDAVQLFKAAVLKGLYGLTNVQTGRLVADRRSFRRFLGLSSDGVVDDRAFSGTLSLFLGILQEQGLAYPLFDRFYDLLDEAGMGIVQGKIADIGIVALAGGRDGSGVERV